MIPDRRNLFLAILFAFMLVLAGRAATIGEERIVSLTLNDGLAGETVYSVSTDHWGFVDIATNSGASFYDGNQLYNIRILDGQGHSVSIWQLCETRGNGVIYAATDSV